jgi:hypothetical protein
VRPPPFRWRDLVDSDGPARGVLHACSMRWYAYAHNSK